MVFKNNRLEVRNILVIPELLLFTFFLTFKDQNGSFQIREKAMENIYPKLTTLNSLARHFLS